MSAEPVPDAPRVASLAMYRDPADVEAATHALWVYLRDRLRARGLAAVPAALDDDLPYDAAWLDPRLLIAQTCGYPFAKRLRGRVRLVATPVYDHAGCDGALNGSVVIVRADEPASGLAGLRGRVAAINGWDSNSGMNLLRHSVASFALQGRFFARVIRSGSHAASIGMVARGDADVAAIDCVTYGNLLRFAPARLNRIRVLTETTKTPGLPLVTRADANDGEVAMLRDALAAFAADEATVAIRDTLGLRGFAVLPESAYDAVLAIEREAAALGYPQLA